MPGNGRNSGPEIDLRQALPGGRIVNSVSQNGEKNGVAGVLEWRFAEIGASPDPGISGRLGEGRHRRAQGGR
jgi:hypothetical protein